MFVAGFAALGVGAGLLLLPPRERRRSGLGAVRGTAAHLRRGAAALARGLGAVGTRTFRSVGHVVIESGRDGVVLIGRATRDYAAVVGRATAGGSSAARIAAPRAWRGLVAVGGSLGGDARSAAIRTVDETGALAHAASRRLSAFVDSRAGRR